MNELKLLWGLVCLVVLVPVFIFLCMALGGSHWLITMPILILLSYGWYKKTEQAKAQKKAAQEQQRIAYEAWLQAQQEAERAQRNADIQQAVENALTADRLKDVKRQEN